jgi:predicted unusual protein kinase regulating ubiquinone biosynthesis (AarF/ABC1/UbiB family)
VQKRARELTHQVADVLYRLHLHNLWHGDTHIGNFMFTRSGELKVIDFGQTVYVPRNQILNMTQHAYSSQTQYEYEYYQYHTSLDRLADSYRTQHAESEIYSGLAHVFSDAAFDTWRVRVNQEFRELVAL